MKRPCGDLNWYSLVSLATDLLGAALSELLSSRQRWEPPTEEDEEDKEEVDEEEEEKEEEPSSPPEPELELPLLWKDGGEEEVQEAKQGWELELSLYMDTGLMRAGEPPQEPT